MTTSYSASFHTASGLTYPAVFFVSPVTITIRYRHNESDQELYWLTENLTAFTEQAAFTELQYPHPQGGFDRLTVKDATAVQALKTALRAHRLIAPAHRRVMGNIWVKLGVLTAIICMVLLMAYLWWVPAIGERAAYSISKESETSMGEKMYESMKPSFTIDTQKTALLNQFFQQLHYNTGYPIEITVVTSDISNAFAIPGGHIVVYDAILDRMKTPEELAALLAHEASHIALRHSLRNIFRDLSRTMFLTLITGGQGDFVSVAINNANELKGLQYSRSLETDADNNGLRLMAASHIDVQGMERLMVMLQKEGGAEAPAAILSTHPIFKDRILNIQEQIKKLPQEPTANATALKEIFRALY